MKFELYIKKEKKYSIIKVPKNGTRSHVSRVKSIQWIQQNSNPDDKTVIHIGFSLLEESIMCSLDLQVGRTQRKNGVYFPK
jgi:hypothetical protein